MKTEEKILEAALDVVQERTISGTRMHHIAEKAKVVQSNVHYYFKTKKDLLKALQEKVLQHCIDIRANDRKKIGATFEEEINVFMEQKKFFITQDKRYDYAEMDFWVQGQIEEDIREDFQKSFSNWRREIRDVLIRYFPDLPEQKLNYIPYVLVSMLEGASLQYLIDPDAFDLDQYFEYCKSALNSMLENEN